MSMRDINRAGLSVGFLWCALCMISIKASLDPDLRISRAICRTPTPVPLGSHCHTGSIAHLHTIQQSDVPQQSSIQTDASVQQRNKQLNDLDGKIISLETEVMAVEKHLIQRKRTLANLKTSRERLLVARLTQQDHAGNAQSGSLYVGRNTCPICLMFGCLVVFIAIMAAVS